MRKPAPKVKDERPDEDVIEQVRRIAANVQQGGKPEIKRAIKLILQEVTRLTSGNKG